MTLSTESVNPATLLVPSVLMIILFGILSLLTAYHFWTKSLREFKLSDNIPGPPSYPVVGNALLALGMSPNEMLSKALNIFDHMESDIGKINVGHKLYIGITDPADIELVLGSNVHLEKSAEYDFFKPWLGEGLLINKETAMGVQKTEEGNAGFEYAKAVMDMCKIIHIRHYKIWLRPDFIFKLTKMATIQKELLEIIHNLTRKVVKRKKEEYFLRVSQASSSLYKQAVDSVDTDLVPEHNIKTENYNYFHDDLEDIEEGDVGEKKRLAFLDFMIEASQMAGNKLTDEEIKEEVDTIMFEGHDTTAAGSSFALCLLGVHQDIQEKCIAELKEIFYDDWNRTVTFADTLQMKYLERVIMETLRLYPPVPLITRKVNEDIKLVAKNYIIPAGTTVAISPLKTHKHTKYWKNPDVFDPDNFLPERSQERHYYAYIPFSAGPRSCVGRKYAILKLKVILASVLRKYKIKSLKKEADFKLQADIILKRSDGFSVTISERIMEKR